MNFTIIVRTSFGMIRRHAVRSVLTVLGITIGIMAIIVTFSIGRGAEMRVKAQIMSLGVKSVATSLFSAVVTLPLICTLINLLLNISFSARQVLPITASNVLSAKYRIFIPLSFL